jgi:predicted phosphodiesterase
MGPEAPRFPRSRDLGGLDGPVLAFGGVLSNLDALHALFAEAARLGIGAERMICTGDVAGYSAEPEECLALLRERRIAAVLGNVEESLARDADDCGCNFVEGSTCDALSGTWYGYARARVSDDSRAWMRATPRAITFRMGGHALTVVHGGLRHISRYVFASDTDALADEVAALGRPGAIIAGHCGIPFSRRAGGTLWHNPGALGLPANDGTPRAWYSLVTAEGAGLRFIHQALAYDHAGAAAKMRKAGLPEAYARALETGLWPDTAILPAREKAATGVPLAPAAASWP